MIDHGKVIADGTSNELKAKTGGQMVEARPADDSDVDAIGRILAEVAGSEVSIDHEAGLVTVSVPDPAVLRAASQRLDDSGLEVAELALRRPSLDEVFFSLTGHPAEDQRDDEGSPA